MADANSVSDTQFLLQSMLQRLKLQPKPENNSTQTQDKVQFGTTVIEQNGGAAGSPPQTPPMYNFDFTMDSKSIVTNLTGLPSPGSTGVATSLSHEFSKGIDIRNSQMSSTPNQGIQSWEFMSNHSVSGGNSSISRHADDDMMRKESKQQKFALTKMSDSSISSLQSTGQVESNLQGQGVGQKKWTQRVKEKWKERYKSTSRREQDDREKQGQSKNTILSPIPAQTVPNENSTTTAFNEEVSVQHQPINNGSVENNPSLLNHMSETLFSPGSFNLMEEIFTGQEWAKFLPSSTISQSQSSSITQHQGMGLTSSISQSHQNKQSMLSQWDNRVTTSPNGGITQSQMNSGGFHTENMFNQRKTSSFGLVSHNGQYGLYDSGSNHLENMDLSVNPLGNNHPIKEQMHVYPYNQSNNTDLTVNPSLSSEQAMEINHNQRGSVHEVLPVLDLSYLQRRLEKTRHVRFSENVTIVPSLVFSDDDGDADDEDYDHNLNKSIEGNQGNDDGGEESPPRPSLPRWIEALRNKTKTKSKPKLKLPRMRTKKYRFM
ncbi:hypothetical protein QTP70_023739 [Hemibagrus guttatus]|uniref:Uncharacterized protein n=1 Tax=Hemibagrus guttatus TaxID=175788 RepID=A0AAE0QYF9_9TELE|nr:hypothetical protein QTP70_023739 [Hemibagrus guttatus]